MADFAFAPWYGAEIEGSPPPTLQTKLDDGKMISREKHANADEVWRERFPFSASQFDTFKAFYASHRLVVPFTKLSFDNGGAPTTEATVRFADKWRLVREGDDWFDVEVPFTRHF